MPPESLSKHDAKTIGIVTLPIVLLGLIENREILRLYHCEARAADGMMGDYVRQLSRPQRQASTV
jgi:hypothetical protein